MLYRLTADIPFNKFESAEVPALVIYPAPFVNWLLFVTPFVIVTAPVPPLIEILVPATIDVTPLFAIVTADEPLYEVPLNPVPIVNVSKLVPNALPLIVELANCEFAIDTTCEEPETTPLVALIGPVILPVTVNAPGILTVVPSSLI